MEAHREVRRKSTGFYYKRFTNYKDVQVDQNSLSRDLDQVLCLLRSSEERAAYKKNMVIQSKHNSIIERLKLEKETTTKLIRCEALRFRQRSRIVRYLENSVPLRVGRQIPLHDDGCGGPYALSNDSNIFRSKSTPVGKNNHLTCIIAPSASDSSTEFRRPFSQRKRSGKTRISSNYFGLGVPKTKLKNSNMWTSVMGQEVDNRDMKQKGSRDIRFTYRQQQRVGKTETDCSKKITPVLSEHYGEEELDDKQRNGSDTSSCQEDGAHFAPIDRDEHVKIVRKVITDPNSVLSSSPFPHRFVPNGTRKTGNMTNTRVGSSLIGNQSLRPRSKRLSVSDLNDLLQIERARFAMNQARLTDFMRQLTL